MQICDIHGRSKKISISSSVLMFSCGLPRNRYAFAVLPNVSLVFPICVLLRISFNMGTNTVRPDDTFPCYFSTYV